MSLKSLSYKERERTRVVSLYSDAYMCLRFLSPPSLPIMFSITFLFHSYSHWPCVVSSGTGQLKLNLYTSCSRHLFSSLSFLPSLSLICPLHGQWQEFSVRSSGSKQFSSIRSWITVMALRPHCRFNLLYSESSVDIFSSCFFFYSVNNQSFTLCLTAMVRPASVLRLLEVWQVIHQGFLERAFPLSGRGMACGGFGKAPQTGEAEGLLTSSGNVTHFSRGAEPWAGGADVAQMSLRTLTHEHACAPTLCAHFLLCLHVPLKHPQKKNQRNLRRVSFGFVVVLRREPLWACSKEVQRDKREGVSGSFRSYQVGFL